MNQNEAPRPYFLAIAGGTASGKSCLTEKLVERLGPQYVSVLLLDSYYRHLPNLTLEQRAAQNFDHPNALELELLPIHLAELSAGNCVEIQDYDFATHLRTSSTHKIAARPVVIVEGILALYLAEARAYYDLKLFIQASDELRITRRLERDVRERGRTRESVLQQWNDSVAPMHSEYCEPTRSYADLIVDGAHLDESLVNTVVAQLPRSMRG